MNKRRTLSDLRIPHGSYPYAVGYIGRDHDIAVERLDALIAKPGNRRELLATIKAIRNQMAETSEVLRSTFERGAVGEGPLAQKGGPTETHPERPYCKPDQTCCDFACGN